MSCHGELRAQFDRPVVVVVMEMEEAVVMIKIVV